MVKHPPMSPDATLAWYKAALDGKMPANRVLLRRMLKLAKLGAACEAGQTANKKARDRYWTSVVEGYRQLPDTRSLRAACRIASVLLEENEHTLRGIYRRTVAEERKKRRVD